MTSLVPMLVTLLLGTSALALDAASMARSLGCPFPSMPFPPAPHSHGSYSFINVIGRLPDVVKLRPTLRTPPRPGTGLRNVYDQNLAESVLFVVFDSEGAQPALPDMSSSELFC